MITGRRKKSDKAKPQLVPTEPPVWSELERRGWVHVMNEKPGSNPKPPGIRRSPKPR